MTQQKKPRPRIQSALPLLPLLLLMPKLLCYMSMKMTCTGAWKHASGSCGRCKQTVADAPQLELGQADWLLLMAGAGLTATIC
jgi:hypothetical protein